MQVAAFQLAGLKPDYTTNLEKIPQHFDDFVTIKKRLKIEEILKSLMEHYKSVLDEDELKIKLGVVMLNINTLFGSVALSVINTLRNNINKRLSEIIWSDKLPCTALPLIERYCVDETKLDEQIIKKGERLRLFLEVDGLGSCPHSQYSDLFFAVGSHKCLGISVTRNIWKFVAQELKKIDTKWKIEDQKMRSGDNVLNFYETAEVLDYE